MDIKSHIAKVVAAVDAATPGSFTEVEMREET
jgi:hypothetical protein